MNLRVKLNIALFLALTLIFACYAIFDVVNSQAVLKEKVKLRVNIFEIGSKDFV